MHAGANVVASVRYFLYCLFTPCVASSSNWRENLFLQDQPAEVSTRPFRVKLSALVYELSKSNRLFNTGIAVLTFN
jgi:hypothetical protein